MKVTEVCRHRVVSRPKDSVPPVVVAVACMSIVALAGMPTVLVTNRLDVTRIALPLTIQSAGLLIPGQAAAFHYVESAALPAVVSPVPVNVAATLMIASVCNAVHWHRAQKVGTHGVDEREHLHGLLIRRAPPQRRAGPGQLSAGGTHQ